MTVSPRRSESASSVSAPSAPEPSDCSSRTRNSSANGSGSRSGSSGRGPGRGEDRGIRLPEGVFIGTACGSHGTPTYTSSSNSSAHGGRERLPARGDPQREIGGDGEQGPSCGVRPGDRQGRPGRRRRHRVRGERRRRDPHHPDAAEGLAANRIRAIFGIINGTCNYIFRA